MNDMQDVVYISGKISNRCSIETKEQFKQAEEALIIAGYTVVNPLRLGLIDNTKTWYYFMKKAIKLMLDCDCVYMLKGWSDSDGAVIEHDLALRLCIPIYYESQQELVSTNEILLD